MYVWGVSLTSKVYERGLRRWWLTVDDHELIGYSALEVQKTKLFATILLAIVSRSPTPSLRHT